KSTRARTGEMAIPERELERLACSPVSTLAVPSRVQETDLPDDRLGIERTFGGLRRNGERIAYSVAGGAARFTETEIKGYRAAFGAIASELESATNGPLLLKDNLRPTFLGNDRPWKPAHIQGEVVDATQIDVRRNTADFQN